MRAFLKKIYNITLLRHVNCVGIGELPELVFLIWRMEIQVKQI